MKVAVIGTGYVGLTTTVALAYLGHDVIAIDKDAKKLALLQAGKSPIYEAGLESLLTHVLPRMRFAASAQEAVGEAEIIMIAVGTPAKPNGHAETGFVEAAARDAAQGMRSGGTYTLVVKSTVPVGTNLRVAHLIERELTARGVSATVHCAANPEFLRESVALRDTFYPDRIVVGANHETAIDALSQLYRPLLEQTFAPPVDVPCPDVRRLPPLITTDPTSAEMIKYAANAFLAVKISYINEIAGLCERVGGNITEVARGVGLDPRIGAQFLNAGLGWGGSCFPKDTHALLAVAEEYGYSLPIVAAAREVNVRQRQVLVDKLQSALKLLRGRVIGILGMAFKPNTDDVRDAPALDIIRLLLERGAVVRVHDPVALAQARALVGAEVDYADDPYALAAGADALVVATEWEHYRVLDWARMAAAMRTPVLVDGRNLLDPEAARRAGLTYMGIGR
jgi:UDPglucose 6-dehydrogenase